VHDGGGEPPTVATAGDVVLVAWPERIAGAATNIELRRLDRAGNPVSATTVVQGVDPSGVTLTSGPSGFLLTWERSQPASPQPMRWLVAQPIDADGVVRAAPFEVQMANSYERAMTRPFASAFFDGAYRVVNDRFPSPSEWAVVDTAARTIRLVGPILYGNRPTSITPIATGALLSMGFSLVRVENDMEVAQYPVPGQLIAVVPGGYQLVYKKGAQNPVVVEGRDLALDVIEEPRVLAEDVEPSGCATGRGHGLLLVACALVLLRRHRLLAAKIRMVG
jgi:hypothetical protein